MNAEALPARKTKRVSSVEFWRFVFTVLVCLYHFEIYFPKREVFLSGSSAVEFFFVLAGFLIAMSAAHKRERQLEPVTTRQAHLMAIDFVKKKMVAILPVIICWIVIYVLTLDEMMMMGQSRLEILMNREWELLFLVGTPFGFNNGFAPNVPMWFLTCLLVMGYIYTFAINRYYDFTRFAAPIIGVMLYIYFGLHTSSTLDHNIAVGFSTAGMVKGAAEIALGISVYQLYEHLSKKKLNIAWRVVISLLELYAIYRFFALTIGAWVGMDNYRRIIYIMIIILTSFLNVTPLTRVLNNKFSHVLGKLSLAMYITHFTLISEWQSVLFKWKTDLMEKMWTSPSAMQMLEFLDGTGGFDMNFRPIPMTVKEAVLYILFVIAVSICITLFVALCRRFIRACRDIYAYCVEKRAAKKAAEEEDNVEVKEE